MTPEAYLDALLALPGLYSATISPDGAWVAWTWMRTAPTAEVYAVPTDGSQSPIRLTDTPEETYFVSWTPDSRAVIVEQDRDGNERAQLFRVDLDAPLTMKPLTEENPNYFIRGGELHPDGRTLVYAANVDVATGEEIEPTWVYRHDLETGERTPIARPEKGGYVVPQLSADGRYVLYNRLDRHPGGWQMWLVDLDGQDDREILNFGDSQKTFGSWFPDSHRVLVVAETTTHKRIGIWQVGSAPNEVRWLLDDPTRNIESAFVPANGRQIVLLEINQARLRCSLLDPDHGTETRLPDVPGNLYPVAPVSEQEWVGVYYSSRQPQDVVRFHLNATSPDDFTSLSRVWERTTLRPAQLTPAEDFHWKSVDGLDVHGWLYRAPGEAKGTVVYVHGGPTAHSQDAINLQIQFFVQQGFNVLDPNYRGSTGYSLAFRESIKQDGWGGREQEDIRTGIEALIAAGIAQPGRIGITGTSYGGYSSWYAITHFTPDVLAASAPICGMTDLVVDYETTRPDLRPYSEEMLGGRPDQVPERYHQASPINFVQNIKGRLLIVQGMQDPNVTPENVRTVTQALNIIGVEYELLAFEDEGHGISKPKNQKTLLPHLAQFFSSAFDGH
ncbi:MAG: prolyl oligopeptidase family serine peptidase [bacterium]|nr:prolyl oligopeptidase family serine peptidase [bacterium]